jgi:hypothetical protein
MHFHARSGRERIHEHGKRPHLFYGFSEKETRNCQSTLCDVPDHLIKPEKPGEREDEEWKIPMPRAARMSKNPHRRHSIPPHYQIAFIFLGETRKYPKRRNRKIIDSEGENLIFCSLEITAQRLMISGLFTSTSLNRRLLRRFSDLFLPCLARCPCRRGEK